MQKYLETAGVQIQFGTEVTNVRFDIQGEKKVAKAIEYVKGGEKKEIALTEDDFVFITNGSCTEGTIYGDQNQAPVEGAEVRTSGCWSLWRQIAAQDPGSLRRSRLRMRQSFPRSARFAAGIREVDAS